MYTMNKWDGTKIPCCSIGNAILICIGYFIITAFFIGLPTWFTTIFHIILLAWVGSSYFAIDCKYWFPDIGPPKTA